MSDFFFEFSGDDANMQCTCGLPSNKVLATAVLNSDEPENQYDSYIYSEADENGDCYDVLFLLPMLDRKFITIQMDGLKRLINQYGITRYTIAPALRCYVKADSYPKIDVKHYRTCDTCNLVPDYDKYRFIAPIDRAMKAVAGTNMVVSWRNFSQFLFNQPTYFFDDVGRKVFPFPNYLPLRTKNDKSFDLRFWYFQMQNLGEAVKAYIPSRIPKEPTINVVTSEQEAKELFLDLKGNDFSFDIETSGFYYWRNDIVCITLSYKNREGYFIDWRYMNNENKALFNDCFKTGNWYIANNGKFDCKFLRYNGIPDVKVTADNMVLHHMIAEDRPHTLDFMTYEFTNLGGYASTLEVLKKKKNVKNYQDLYVYYPDAFIRYSVYDSIVSFQVWDKLVKQAEDQELMGLYKSIYMDAFETFTQVEMNGIMVDQAYMREYSDTLKKESDEIRDIVWSSIGKKINLNSKQEISETMKSLGIPIKTDSKGNPLSTKAGNHMLNKQTLPLYMEHEFVYRILEYNHINKIINQLKVPEENDEFDFHIFEEWGDEISEEYDELLPYQKGFYKRLLGDIMLPEFNLIGTDTGRVSGSGGVNFQNMPKSVEGKKFRKVFIPRAGFLIGERDFSNAEMRVAVMVSGDQNMKDLINNGWDMHCMTASKVMGVSYEEFMKEFKAGNKEYKEARQKAKSVNFGVIYGITRFGLARQLNNNIMEFNVKLQVAQKKGERLDERPKEQITPEQCQEFINAYFESYPKIEDYIDNYRIRATQDGYIRNCFGRLSHLHKIYGLQYDPYSLKDLNDEEKRLFNNSINSPIQGTIGILTIDCMNKIRKEFENRKLKSKIILQVHDSIVFEVAVEEIVIVDEITKSIMNAEYPFYGDMEMKSDFEIGSCWGYGKDLKYWRENPEEFLEEVNFIQHRNRVNGIDCQDFTLDEVKRNLFASVL
jgi:DNA polymerase I-like protein with 3'-5' exonuclease and polymerase domains